MDKPLARDERRVGKRLTGAANLISNETSGERRCQQMSDRPLISVIIIFLNAERFIQEAIESVFAQTYENWELLLVNDGSTDGSPTIARKYAERYPGKVHYLEHEGHQNRGMSASRNLGIHHSAGEFIAFLDADDVWFSHKLEQQVTILEAHPQVAMVYGLSQWWYSWTRDSKDSQRDFVHNLGVPSNTVIQPPALLSSFFFRQEAAIPCPSNILVRRVVIKHIGGFEEGFLSIHQSYEDQAFYAKICLAAPVFASNRCWDKYRRHPDSCVSVVEQRGQAYTTRLFFLNWLSAYLTEKKVEDDGIWQDLQAECWRCQHPFLYRLISYMRHRVQQMKQWLLPLARRVLPITLYYMLRARLGGEVYSPPAGQVHLGSLRRLTPFSREFGYDRGRPIDRYYIENFLLEHQGDVQGHVLEIADDNYTRWFGGERVRQSDVLHVAPGDPKATIIGDLTSLDHVLSDTFDCIILTQTLQFIYNVRSALQTVYRILKPGGVVIVTFPGLSPVSRYDMERWGYFWGFTSLSARRLFEEAFPEGCVHVQAYGNVLTAAAFLYGMATEELRREEMDHVDPDYEVIIAIRARKPD